MEKRKNLLFKENSKEEYLPGYSKEFPYISSYVELDKFPRRYAPWHWHDTLELFYVKSGVIEYYTPQGKSVFTSGMGGLINSNVLHMTKLQPDTSDNVQLIHLFDASFIAGERGSVVEQKYVRPLISDVGTELVVFSPEEENAKQILELLRESFTLSDNEMGYEIRLRNILSEIWIRILQLVEQKKMTDSNVREPNNQIKQMMMYVQEHYAEKITVAQVAGAAFLSERACYRIFQTYLHTSPTMYIRSNRLQMACQMLTQNDYAIGEIGEACGLGSSSYFGKVFKEEVGCTPLEYRYKNA